MTEVLGTIAAVIGALVQSSYGITLKMETADNSAFEGGFEATVE